MADRAKVPCLLAAHKGNLKAVADELGRSTHFVRMWADRAAQGKGFGNAPGAGRPRAMSSAAIDKGKRICSGRIRKSAADVARQLLKKGLTSRLLCPTTILTWLNTGRSAVRSLSFIRRVHLTSNDKLLRRQWVARNKNTQWKAVMFTDSKIVRTGQHSARRRLQRVNRREAVSTTQSGFKCHVYAGVTWNGLTALQFVSGTTGFKFQSHATGKVCKGVTQEEYQDVMDRTLIPEGRRLLRRGFTVYQDGASVHTAHSTREKWRRVPDVRLLQGSRKSPDLNICENCWELLERQTYGRTFRSARSFQRAVEAAWRTIPLSTIRKLYGSYPRRLRKVKEMRGGHIERNIYT